MESIEIFQPFLFPPDYYEWWAEREKEITERWLEEIAPFESEMEYKEYLKTIDIPLMVSPIYNLAV